MNRCIGIGGRSRLRSEWLRTAHRWAGQRDPVKIAQTPVDYYRYLKDWLLYRRMPGAEPLRLVDSHPAIHDRTPTTAIDSHYFYANAWAMRRIVDRRPAVHVDIASHHMLGALLAGVLPVVFVDYRPLDGPLRSLHPVAGNALGLPFADGSIDSLSCLHAAEHIGLGRYGDALDPDGTRKACHELVRVLAPSGALLFAVPVGRHRTCFNAHRVHAASEIIEYFGGLQLHQFSLVEDSGRFAEQSTLEEASGHEYACGLFEFRKP